MSKAGLASIVLAVAFSCCAMSCQEAPMTKGPSASMGSTHAPAPTHVAASTPAPAVVTPALAAPTAAAPAPAAAAPAPAIASAPTPSGPYGFLATISAASILVIPLLGFAAFMGRR